jgi:hypothetical protein
VYYTTIEESNATYLKVMKVIKSCRRTSQLTVAAKYTSFFLKLVHPNHQQQYSGPLRKQLKVQSAKIQWNYGS